MADRRRDLHIGIDGDARGLDRAVDDAEDSLRGLDRELAKTERQLTAQERVSARAAVAVKQFGNEQDKAALAARKLGTEAKRAAEQAEQAQVRADAAAKAYERGLIDEEKAARAAARADAAIERAAIKAAEAHRAAARAADQQAQQERQLARDAELGAAAENLAIFKASGRVKEHNALLTAMHAKYGDIGRNALSQFETIETAGSRAASGISGLVENFSILGKSGPVSIGLVIGALELLPTVATIAGGAVALGLGGALALVGIKAQASAADVQDAFAQLKENVAGDLGEISAPFHATLLEIAANAQYAFNSLKPALESAFAQIAPAISRFSRYFAASLSQLDPAIESIGRAFSAVLDTLGPQMDTVMHNIGTGIKAITDATAANPQALASFVTLLSKIVRYTGDVIGFLIRYSSQINAVFKNINMVLAGPIGLAAGLIFKVKGAFESGGKAIPPYASALTEVDAAAKKADTAHQQLVADMTVLASATKSVEDKTNALNDAFTKFLDPQQAVFKDTAQLEQGLLDLSAALIRSGGSFGDATQPARDAKTALGGLIDNAQQLATDMTASGDSIVTVRQQLMPYIATLYQLTGGNDQARKQVDTFVRSLGMIPPAVDESGKMIAGFTGTVRTLPVPMDAAQQSAVKLAEDFETLRKSTASAEDKTNALSDAFTRLLDPQLAAYQDTARLRQGLDDLAAALKKSHGALGDNSKSARDAKEQFASLLKDSEQFASDLTRSGSSLSQVQQALKPYILSLYRAAGGNKEARHLVDLFARSLQLVPNKKGTQLTSNAAAQKRAMDAYKRSIDSLPKSRTINIFQVMHLTETQAYLNKRKNILGYAHGGQVRGYATGGQVQSRAAGGPSGYVTGPGSTTSDSILTRLSNREFVVNAKAAAANLPLLEAINSGRSVPVGGAAVMSGQSGGASMPIDYDRLAGALVSAMRREGVGAAYLDGKAITDDVSRRIGRSADQRRRTG